MACIFIIYLFIYLAVSGLSGQKSLWHVFLLFIYLAVSGLSCGTRDLSLWGAGFSSCGTRAPEHTGSVVAVRQLSCPAACGILVPRPGIEPTFLHWKVDS